MIQADRPRMFCVFCSSFPEHPQTNVLLLKYSVPQLSAKGLGLELECLVCTIYYKGNTAKQREERGQEGTKGRQWTGRPTAVGPAPPP